MEITTSNKNEMYYIKFESFFNDLMILYNKCQYSKVIEEIEDKKSFYTKSSTTWLINNLTLSSIFKQSKKRINKAFMFKNSNSINHIGTINNSISIMTNLIKVWKDELISRQSKNKKLISNNTLIDIANNEELSLNKLYSSLNMTKKYQEELILNHSLEVLILQSLLTKNQGRDKELIFILTIALKFIMNYLSNSTTSKIKNIFDSTSIDLVDNNNHIIIYNNFKSIIESANLSGYVYSLSSQVILMISNYLIRKRDFHTAYLYQDLSIRLCIKQINFEYTKYFYVNESNTIDDKVYNKLFNLCSLSLYQRGICIENIGNKESHILKAIESYKQANWFATKYLKLQNSLYYEYINNIQNLIINEYYLKYNRNHKDKNKKITILFKKYHHKRATISISSNHRNINTQAIINSIKQMKFNEAEDVPINYIKTFGENKTNKTNFTLSSYKIINTLLSKRYRPFLQTNFNNKKTHSLFKYSKDFQEKLCREIAYNNLLKRKNTRKVYFKNKIKKLLGKDLKLGKINSKKNQITISNQSSTNFNLNSKHTSTARLRNINHIQKNSMKKTHIKSKSRNVEAVKEQNTTITPTKNTLFSTKDLGSNEKLKNSLFISSILKKTNELSIPVNKKSTSKIIFKRKTLTSTLSFNKKFKNELNTLKSYENKEFCFHKKLLKIKSEEKFLETKFDNGKERKRCELFFNSKMTACKTQIDKLINGNKNEILISKKKLEINKVEHSAISSLNTKVLDKYLKMNSTISNSVINKSYKNDQFKYQSFHKALNEKYNQINYLEEKMKKIKKII